jgi:amino acid adenylation domain-containing protein
MNDLVERIAALSPGQRARLLPQLRERGSEFNLFPLSFAQERLWFINELEPGSRLHNMPTALQLNGSLNVTTIEECFSEIVRRHEILRTNYLAVEGHPFQMITQSQLMTMPVVDLSELPEAEQEIQQRRLALEQSRRSFDLGRGSMLRINLLRLSWHKHALLFMLHHITCDAWSRGLLIREVVALYKAFLSGQPSPLPELPIQYADYAIWQRKWLQGKVFESQLRYWKDQLGDASPLLELPTDRPRPKVQSLRGAVRPMVLSNSLSEKLRTLSRRENATLFSTLLAAYKTLLYRYTGQRDILTGTPIASRNRPEVEGLIGLFLNTLVLRCRMADHLTFRELLEQVCDVVLEAQAHQDFPFEKLVEELQPQRSLTHTPLFQVWFTLENTPQEELSLPNLQLKSLEGSSQTAEFDLSLVMTERGGKLVGALKYATHLFNPSTIERLVSHFQMLLESIVEQPEQPVSSLPLLTSAEQQQLLVEWNDTFAPYAEELPIHQLFERWVEQQPDQIAVIYGENYLSYEWLNCQANQLAHYLKGIDVGPDVYVGLCLERSPEMLVGILGILKAGAAYLPLDPTYPKDRLAFMLEDSKAVVVLTRASLLKRLPEHRVRVVCVDSDRSLIARQSSHNPPNPVTPDNLAYVIYTSGSTGKPKGVMLAHKGVANLIKWQSAELGATPDSRIAQFFSYNFDGAVGETFMALLNGATLVMLDEANLNPQELMASINRHSITFGVFVPSLLRQLNPALLQHARDFTMVSVGEACPADLAEEWSQYSRFINGYGPTEYTVYSHIWKASQEKISQVNRIPIGSPIDNTKTFLLDNSLNPVPVGVIGEIYISGPGIARGYLNRPEITGANLIPNPFFVSHPPNEHGDLQFQSACSDIERFKLTINFSNQFQTTGPIITANRLSADEVMKSVQGLDPDLIVATSRFVEQYSQDGVAYEGFCRYLQEGARESYSSCGINQEVLKRILGREDFNGLRGLDFGFGHGEIMQTLSRAGACMKGLDISPFFVQRAREKGLDARLARIDTAPEDFTRVCGIEAGSQNFALCTLVLDRIERPKNLLRNLFLVLEPGGRFAIQTLLPIISVDDGDVETPIVYTPEPHRITSGETVDEDKRMLVRLLVELGGKEINICRLPYVVASRDGIQDYQAWSFFGRKRTEAEAAMDNQNSWRMYKTGDLGRYLPDGSIEFLGRIDHQVKLRGFRIELNEITAALEEHEGVAEGVVIVREDIPGDKRLVAYVVSRTGVKPEINAWRSFLQERLPDYMVPTNFVILDELPRTLNAKVDRNALPAPETTVVEDDADFLAPRTPIEEIVAGIWAQVLGIEKIGINDDFFSLGGHSLLATQVISRILETFQANVPLQALFNARTLAELVDCIETAIQEDQGAVVPAIEPLTGNQTAVLSYAQQRLWIMHQLAPNDIAYNSPVAVRLTGYLHLPALEQTLNEIVRRHAVLRTTFYAVDGQPVQMIGNFQTGTLSTVDLRRLEVLKKEVVIKRLASEEGRRPFDLARGPLLRAKVARLSVNEYAILLTMHHIVSDGWSMGVLIREVGRIYEAFLSGEPLPLPELPVQYADYAVWQQRTAAPELDRQLDYWKAVLADASPAQALQAIYKPSAQVSSRGATEIINFSEHLSEALKALSREQGSTLFMTLLAGFKVTLHYLSGREDIIVGTDVANRNRVETEGLIGFMVNELVLRTDLSGDPTFTELLWRVRKTSLDAYAHQDMPFDRLVSALNLQRDLNRNPLFQVLFGVMNTPSLELRLPNLTLETLDVNIGTSVHDLSLYISDTSHGLIGKAKYKTDLFDRTSITRIVEHYKRVLNRVATYPDTRLSVLVEELAEADRQQNLLKENVLAEARLHRFQSAKRKTIRG